MAFGFLRKRKSNYTLEDQLQILAELGICARPNIKSDDFLALANSAEYEAQPFKLALCVLGGEIDHGPEGARFSDDVWHFDTECICDDIDYIDILKRMRDLAQGYLPLKHPRAHLDDDRQSGWVEFEIDGQTIHWDVAINDDWIDHVIFTKLASLLRNRGPEKIFTYLDLGGQDCILGCCDPEQLRRLRKQTKLLWLPLS